MNFLKTKSIMLKAVLLIAAIISTHFLQSQAWLEDLPQSKVQNGNLTLRDYQKAFNDYWEPLQVENGYFVKNGEKVKAPYWKQFKRWEWFWEIRVDPKTGAFPITTAADEYQKYLLEIPGGSRSPSGNWTSMGPSSSGGGYAGLGRLNCVAFRPGDVNTIYVGAASGGIWKSSDGGSSWTPLGDNNAVLGVSDIIVINQVAGPDILYIATGDKDGGSVWSLGGQQSNDNNSVGVLKSTDGGITWNPTGLSFSASQKRTISRLILDPNSAYQTIYAATSDGIYKTTDGGTTWPRIYGASIHFIDMEMNPSSSSTLYASTIDYWGSPKIYYTTNGGASWNISKTFATTEYRVDIAVTAANSAYVYAIVSDINTNINNNGGLSSIERSTNTGVSFSSVYTYNGTNTNLLNWDCSSSLGGGQGAYDLCIVADPSNANTIFIGGVNTWKSTNGGSSWNINTHWSGNCGGTATTVHADQHFMAYQPGTSNLFLCNDGGLYKTTNGGNSWTDKTNSMVISQLYRLGVGQATSVEVITGLQDNGTKIYSAGTWMDKIGGDGMECIVDYTNNNTQYGTLYYGDIYRTTNHWVGSFTGTQITPPDPTNPPSFLKTGAWVTPYVLDPNNNQTIIVGYDDVYKSTNQGTNWSTISSGFTGGTDLRSLAIAQSNSNYIYVATLSNIWKTTVGGGTGNWTNITGTLPVGSDNITYISVKNDDPNTVWVSFGGYSSNGVYQTTNGGTTWTNISSGLPSLPVMCVIQNAQNTGNVELYAGTDVGVYVYTGGSWAPFSTGLPNVVLTELEIYYGANPSNSLIRAATFGRGLWESDLYSVTTTPDADFTADNTTPNIFETVTFTDQSTNNPISWLWAFTPSTVTFMGGTNASSQNPQVRFDVPGAYDVALTATNAGGSDSETKVDYIVVTYPAPVTDFVADNLSPTTIDTVTFTDMSSNFPDTWLWTFTPSTITYTDGTNQNSQNLNVRFDEPGIYTIELIASNGGGSDNEIKTDYIVVTYPAPVIDFSADNTSPTTIDEVTFTDMSTYYPYAWSWTFSPSTITFVGGTDQNSQHPEVLFDQVGLYTVELTATNDGGDGTLTKVDYINVREALSVAVTASPDEICIEESSQLFATPAGGSGNYAYSWTSNPSGFISTEQNPVITPLVTTVYTVELDDGEHIVSADAEITVHLLPAITLGDWPELLCNQEEPPVQLTAAPVGGIYSGNHVTTDGIFSPEEASIGWNVITYTYEDNHNCETLKQDSIYVDQCVGIKNNLSNDVSVLIYPNPNTGSFSIKSNQLITKVEIANMLGEIQFSKSVEASSVHFNTGLVKGMYIIHIFVTNKQNGSLIVKKKIVIY